MTLLLLWFAADWQFFFNPGNIDVENNLILK